MIVNYLFYLYIRPHQRNRQTSQLRNRMIRLPKSRSLRRGAKVLHPWYPVETLQDAQRAPWCNRRRSLDQLHPTGHFDHPAARGDVPYPGFTPSDVYPPRLMRPQHLRILAVYRFGSTGGTIPALFLFGKVVDFTSDTTLGRRGFDILWGKPSVVDYNTFT